jgi:colicin import membrane protein
MPANLPVAFGALAVGGILISHGVAAARDAFGGSGPAAAAPSPVSSSPAAAGGPAGAHQGAVSRADLAAVGGPYGWSGGSLDAWWRVIGKESGGDPAALNPSSGAFGIGQFLGATKAAYAKYGATSSNPTRQLQAMARYIKDRYGSPEAALAWHEGHGWY